jgi:hypothetical protein
MFVRPVLFPLPIRHRDEHGVVAIPPRRPHRAQTLSANLIGLSIEMDRWDTWAGPEVGKPNVYVKQMLRNLGDKVGSPPCIRVGGEWARSRCYRITVPIPNP